MIIHSFLLIGQSNMAGRGSLNEAEKINEQDILVLRNGRWQPFYRPVNNDRAFSGVCLAESFAEKYANEHNIKVGLIPCADGGTNLEQWSPGGLLYDNAVYQTRLAKRTSTIAGILWHQGESDCAENRLQTYEERLCDFFENLRKDADINDVPIVIGALGDYLKEYKNDPEIMRNYQKINVALKNAASRIKRCAFAPDNGYPCNSDKLHFSSKGLYMFGLSYYNSFLIVENKSVPFKDMPTADFANRNPLEAL